VHLSDVRLIQFSFCLFLTDPSFVVVQTVLVDSFVKFVDGVDALSFDFFHLFVFLLR